jgi:hypothetical protein
VAGRFRFERGLGALHWLAARPGALTLVLVALDAMARPYARFAHDARLYAVQVLNRSTGGEFGDDLFLRFGSQDAYSYFSALAAPVVGWVGIEWTFFAFYLVSHVFLMGAMVRFVRTLVQDGPVAVGSLLYLAMAPVPYGGLGIFHVVEPFFTPRLPAVGLSLLAFEALLRGRHGLGLTLAVAAAAVHPLMGAGVVLVGAGTFLAQRVPRGIARATTLLTLSAGVGLIVWPAAGKAVFGTMDEAWLDIVRRATGYNFPVTWTPLDWLRVIVSSTVVLVAGWQMRTGRPQVAVVLLLCALTGLGGLFVTIAAGHAPYAFAFQAQPYRALWLLALLQVPLALLLARRLWAGASAARRIALIVMLWLVDIESLGLLWLALLVLPIVVVLVRGLKRAPARESWLVGSVLASVVVVQVGWLATKLGILLSRWTGILQFRDAGEVTRIAVTSLGGAAWTAVALSILPWLVARGWRVTVAWSVAVAASAHLTMFLVPYLWWDRLPPDGADLAVVRDHLGRAGAPAGRRPTVYGDWGRTDYLWIHLGVTSYFVWDQLAGVLFSRETAAEAGRRALIIGRFELDRYRRFESHFPSHLLQAAVALYAEPLDGPPPAVGDLVRLCHPTEGVDVVVLHRAIGELHSTTNGRVYVYDCRHVRRAGKGA